MEEEEQKEVEEKSKLQEIQEATEKLKEENDRREKILESEKAEGILSGTGGINKEEKKEETPEEYKDKVMRGEL